MKFEIWPNHENTFFYIGEAHIKGTNIKRYNLFKITFIQHRHSKKEDNI